MSNEITMSAVRVVVTGKTSSERKLSVINSASGGAMLALTNMSGAVGKAARSKTAQMGLASIVKSASHDNYRPLAEYLAARLGECIVITNRASFESLPDQMEQRILKAQGSKSGGYRECKKTGAMVPSATLALAMTLKAECIEVIAQQQEMRDERIAAKEAAQAAITA